MTMMIYLLMFLLLAIVLMLLTNTSVCLEFSLMSFPHSDLAISFMLDPKSLMFLMTVNAIYLSVCKYTMSYLGSEVYLKRFMHILMTFVLSMFLLISSSSLFTSLVGWDGLGTTSMFLILFYYSNTSMKASTLTFLMNRVGDCMFIMFLVNILLMGEYCVFHLSSMPVVVSLLAIVTSMTKSAQVPFSSWLPAAMEAPTPVSALVHSSTLVTAGIYILYRYNHLWSSSELCCNLLMIFSVSTCIMAAMSGLVENDLKKLIALSTLSQLGFIMFSFSLNQLAQGYTHMLTHAFFKALLFMSAGLLIHSFNGSQKIQLMSISKSQSPMVITVMVVAISSMIGLPFLSGFYSKDLVLDFLHMKGWPVIIMATMIISFMLTVIYSMRMMWYLLNSSSNWNMMSDSDFKMLNSMMPMVALSIVGGSIITWLSYDLSLTVDFCKIPVLMIVSTTILLYWSTSWFKSSHFLESKWFLASMNCLVSKSFFGKARFYSITSDLWGLPEIFNKMVVKHLHLSNNMSMSMKGIYMSNLEMVLFILVLMALVV